MWEIWDPFEDMRHMQKALRNAWEMPMELRGKQIIREPLADVLETKDSVIAKIELPGIDKKDVTLNVTDNMLAVKAEKKAEVKEEKEGFSRHERSYQSFQRAFSLPTKVIADKATAELKNGILEVKMPKQKPAIEESKVKKIEVK